jgi:hypothetical protein
MPIKLLMRFLLKLDIVSAQFLMQTAGITRLLSPAYRFLVRVDRC